MRSPLQWALDASVFFSFDRSGYERHARSFRPLPEDLSGRTMLVTGANSGIGRACALALGERGAAVQLLCRNAERGAEAEASLRAATGNQAITFELLDVSDLVSIERYAARAPERIDALVHNAGLLPAERSESPQGLELTLATHAVGPFALTHALRPALQRARGARVVWVSSGGMYTQRLSLDDVQWERRDYDGVQAYAMTKRFQVALSEAFAARWHDVISHAMHPGWADSPGVERSLPGFYRCLKNRLRTPAQGADTALWLACAEEPTGSSGCFWFDRRVRSTHLLGKRAKEGEREALWSACERWAGLS